MIQRFLLLLCLSFSFLFYFQLNSYCAVGLPMIKVDFPGGDTSNNRADFLRDIMSFTGFDKLSFYNTESENQYNSVFTSGAMNPNNYVTFNFKLRPNNTYYLTVDYSTNDKVIQGSGTNSDSHAYIPTKRFYFYEESNGTLRASWQNFNSGTEVDTTPIPDIPYYILCQLPTGFYELKYNIDFGVDNYSNLTWNKNTSSTISVTSNGVTKDVPLYKYSRSVNSFKLGTFTNWADTHIEVSVGPYVADNVIDASWGKATINKYGDIQNGNKIGFVKNGSNLELWCSLPFYLYNQTYGLTYAYRKDTTQAWQNGYFDFVIMPYGSTDTTANLVNSDLDNNTDVAFVNTIDQILNYTSGDIQNDNNYVFGLNSFGNIYSGDFFSGDLIGKIGFEDYTSENDYNLFIYRIYRNVLDIFVGANETANESISFTLHGHTYTIYARDFFIPEGRLKVFIRLFLTAGMVILFIQQIYKIVINFTIFDFKGVSRTFDQDQTFFM